MDDEEDMDIAAAMGFGSFGGSKKRKYDHATSPEATGDASGANSTQLGIRTNPQNVELEAKPHVAVESPEKIASILAAPRDQSRNDAAALETVSFGGPPITKGELNALKFGVRDKNGDIAYFLPSFLEDPWASLQKAGT